VGRFLDSDPTSGSGRCASVDEAKTFLLANHQVDLVLLDFDLGERDGIDFMRVAESIGYEGKVLLVTAGLDETSAANLVKRGIAGIFLKHNLPPCWLMRFGKCSLEMPGSKTTICGGSPTVRPGRRRRTRANSRSANSSACRRL